MAVVPWTYNNPRVNSAEMTKRSFGFFGMSVEVFQDTTADINLHQNTELRLWDGGYYLARYLEENRGTLGLSGKRCLELGAGCGLVGLVAWLLGADTTLTDLPSALSHTSRVVNHNVERLVKENSNLSARASSIGVQPYQWGENCQHLSASYDVILGSDIIYNPELSKDLCDSIQRLGHSGTVAIFSYKRRGLGEENFFTLAQENFIVKKVEFVLKEFLDAEYVIIHMTAKC